jgi:hypothetical protein
MTILPENITDYTSKDFDSLRARLFNLIASVFPEWTDFNVANFGNIMVELFAHVGDVLGFYLDNHARESRISTATQRRSLIALSKLLGFTPTGAVAATADVTLTLAEVPANDVTIPAGTIVRTLAVTNPIRFQTLTPVTIAASTNPPTATVSVENSETKVEAFTSNGQPDQEIRLTFTPFLDSSLTLTALNGTYTVVDNFLSSTSSDLHLTITVDQNDRATVRFGNGVQGALPQGAITATYKTGGGVSGNVDAGTIQRIEGAFTDVLANPVTVSVTNANAASGGADRQTVEQIRDLAPESIRTINRTVSREDYEINARKVAGVSRALMLTSNERAAIPENQGHLHIIPTGGGVPSTALKASVLTQVTVTFPNTLTFLVDVRDPEYLNVDIQCTVFLSSGASASVVDSLIRQNLTNFFAISNSDGSDNDSIDFGFNFKDVNGNPAGEIPFSDIYNVIRDTTGVRKIGDAIGSLLINSEPNDLTIEVQQFPQLGTVTILNGDTGSSLV